MVNLEKQHELITQAKEIAIWLAEYLVQNLFYYYTAGKIKSHCFKVVLHCFGNTILYKRKSSHRDHTMQDIRG